MTRHYFNFFAVLLALFLSACAGPKVYNNSKQPDAKDRPYVSRLDEPQSNAYFHYSRARLLLAEGDHAGAIEAYQKAIDYDPDSDDLRFELAELYLGMEQPKNAVRTVEDILLRNPDSVRANQSLANLYFRNRQPAEAIPYFKRILELDPASEQARLHLAIALVRVGELDHATTELKELLRRYPDSQPGHLALARLYRETDLNQLAIEQYRELIRRLPDEDQGYLELGLLFEDLKEWQNALDVFAEVLTQRPLDFALRHHLARVYVGMERYDDALEELQIIIDLKPEDFDARRKVGLIFLEQERWTESADVFEEILELNPNLDPVRYYLGMVYEKLEAWEPALEAFLGIDQGSALYDDAVSHLGYIYLETGRVGDAIDLLEARLAEGQARPQVFNSLASLYMVNEQTENALKTVEDGVAIHPDNIELLYRRGLILERAGRHEDAIQAMKSLLSIDDKHAEALNFLAYALAVENRDLDDALEYAQRAIDIKPAPHILDTLGWVYYRLGRLLEALKVIEEASRQLSDDAVVFEHLGDIHLELNNLAEARAAFMRALKLQPDNTGLLEKLDKLAESL